MADLHADGDIGFSKEYEAIQAASAQEHHPAEHSQHPENKQKNRYLNIVACGFFHSIGVHSFITVMYLYSHLAHFITITYCYIDMHRNSKLNTKLNP